MPLAYSALATDYDGTIAHDGCVDAATLAALQRARDAGLRLVLVTGRELNDLANTFGHTDVFDRVVAENGAVLFDPRSAAVRRLAPAPPPSLVRKLTEANVPISVGHSIIATVEPYERVVQEAIQALDLEWQVIFNKGSVMVLPRDSNKATGLSEALRELGVRFEETIGVGDAENDHAFLATCGLSVAVANALPSVKELVHLVMEGASGDGVTQLIDKLLAGSLTSAEPANP